MKSRTDILFYKYICLWLFILEAKTRSIHGIRYDSRSIRGSSATLIEPLALARVSEFLGRSRLHEWWGGGGMCRGHVRDKTIEARYSISRMLGRVSTPSRLLARERERDNRSSLLLRFSWHGRHTRRVPSRYISYYVPNMYLYPRVCSCSPSRISFSFRFNWFIESILVTNIISQLQRKKLQQIKLSLFLYFRFRLN